MKKTFIIIMIALSSVLSFSEKLVQKKKLDLELKTMLIGGADFTIFPHAIVSLEFEVYKKFEVKKIDTIFNVGVGLDFSNCFDNASYAAIIVPYFSTEIGGYILQDIRMYTNIKIGVGSIINSVYSDFFPKASLSLGMTYKENFTAEIGTHFPRAVTLGFGSRFGF